jgi:hypothetical protein
MMSKTRWFAVCALITTAAVTGCAAESYAPDGFVVEDHLDMSRQVPCWEDDDAFQECIGACEESCFDPTETCGYLTCSDICNVYPDCPSNSKAPDTMGPSL